MSDEKETASAGKAGGKKMVLMIVLLVGTLAGGGAGAVFAGPALASMILGPEGSAAPASTESDAHAAPAGQGESGHGAGAATYLVENLVLNPAQSNGTRFLMASVAFDLIDETAVSRMESRDAQVRDAVLTVLGHKTVDQLTDVGARDSLKNELKSSVAGIVPEGAVRGIYLPQFVIQ